MDYASFLLITVGVGSLEVVLSRGERFDWLNSNFIKAFAFCALAGLALANTVLDRRTQFHHAVLAGQVTPFNPAYQHRLAGLEQALGARAGADATTVHAMGLQALGLQLGRQASALAFIDVFQMVMLLFIALSPLVLLLGRPRERRPAPA